MTLSVSKRSAAGILTAWLLPDMNTVVRTGLSRIGSAIAITPRSRVYQRIYTLRRYDNYLNPAGSGRRPSTASSTPNAVPETTPMMFALPSGFTV